MSTLKFGKFKGQEISEVAKDDRGRGWLEWYLKQPVNEKYAEKENKIRGEIMGILGGSSGAYTVGKVETSYSEPNSSQYFQQIIMLLEKMKADIDEIKGLLSRNQDDNWVE